MNRRKYLRAAVSALALCLCAAAVMLVSPAASGQKESPAALEIGRVLESFETVALDPAGFLRDARADGAVTLRTARGAFELEVEPFDVRSDDYRAVAAGEGGVMTELARTPSNSWRGRVRGQEGTFVRLYLDGQKIQGIIITPGETFFVEPARDISAAAGAKDFLFYAESSVKPSGNECVEMTLGGKVATEAARSRVPKAAPAATGPTPEEAFAPKPRADVATEADFEYFQQNGGNKNATNNDILAIMTQVDGVYDAELGIRIRVVFQRVWTTNTDPYTSNKAETALNQLTASYNGSFSPGNPDPDFRTPPARDLVHMFTGKTLVDDNGDPGTIGVAWTGALCDIEVLSYGISQSRFVGATGTERVALTAHELGHNFGANHTNPPNQPPVPDCDQSQSIMNMEVQETTKFCQFSRDQITSHVTGTGGECLERLAPEGCSYGISPASQSFSISAASGTVNVTATAGCDWGVAEGSPWVTVTGPEAGTGNGSTSYSVSANTGNDGPRRAFVEIGGEQLAISQQGSPACLAKATRIDVGQTLTGTFASSDCTAGQPGRPNAFEDLYTFTARAGQRVRIELSTPGSDVDTYLYLFGPDNSVVEENDDITLGDVTDSRIPNADAGFLTLPQTGVYTIGATTFDNNAAGGYSLTLTDDAATNTVSLSSAGYAVNEGTGGGLGADGAGFRVVTVTRSGDAAGAATVDYATADGTASKQKDYTQALGTLVFAPNETSKTFTVFVDDDAFAEGAETVQLTLSNPVGTRLGANAAATLTINSNDAASGPSPVRAQSFDTAFFVRQQYLDFLSREPDDSGFNFWRGDFDQCGADEQCKEVKRIHVSAAFFLSIEFQNTGYLVYRMYKTAYGDATSPNVAGTVPVIRLNEFLPDTQRIGQHVVVGANGWDDQLKANKSAFALEFVLRPRFLAAYPLSMTPGAFVDKLSSNAGLSLNLDEWNALAAQLNATSNVGAGRAAVLMQLAEHPTLKQNETRRAFVLMQYYGYLRRNPDDPQDTDFRGWMFWLDKLNEFNGDFVAAEMVKAFITSDEYIDRFGTRP